MTKKQFLFHSACGLLSGAVVFMLGFDAGRMRGRAEVINELEPGITKTHEEVEALRKWFEKKVEEKNALEHAKELRL